MVSRVNLMVLVHWLVPQSPHLIGRAAFPRGGSLAGSSSPLRQACALAPNGTFAVDAAAAINRLAIAEELVFCDLIEGAMDFATTQPRHPPSHPSWSVVRGFTLS